MSYKPDLPPGASEQVIFNYVCNALVRQKVPSARGGGKCVYRGPDNRKCAVGFLLADECYREDMDIEGMSSNTPPVKLALAASLSLDADAMKRLSPVFDFLQRIHDSFVGCDYINPITRESLTLALNEELFYSFTEDFAALVKGWLATLPAE